MDTPGVRLARVSPPPALDAALARARLEELRHAASDVVMLFDPDGVIVDANDRAEVAYGLARADLVGRSIFDLRPDPDEARRQFATVLQQGEIRFATRHRRADGTTTPVDVVSRRLVADGRVYVQSIIHDRGEIEALMDRLLESEERYRATFEEAPVAIKHVSLDDRVLGANARYAELVGRTVEELRGTDAGDVIHPEDRALDAGPREALQRGEITSYRVEKRYVRPSGEVRVGQVTVSLRHDRAGAPSHYIGVVEDVTELRAARREVEERRIVHEKLLRTARDAIHVIDATGRLREHNPAFEAHLGYPASVLRDLRVADWDAELQGDALADLLARLTSAPMRFETKHRCADGTVRTVEIEAAPMTLLGETLVYCSARDVTERVRMAATLSARDRMVTVGTLAAGVGHEINNPLTAVSMNLELLAEEIRVFAGGSPSGRLRDMAEMIREAKDGAERVRRIVRGLRTFARGDHIELAEVELSQAVDIAVHLSMNELRTVTRIVKAWGPCPTIIADESQLAQIFVNLLVNAAHALAGRAVEANEIRVATRTTADGRAVVEIEDNGPGMTKEVAARAFEPFFTTKPAGQGTGLGLSIVHNLVAGMGATVDLRTAPGEGAAFTITFPHRTADELPRPPPPRGESPPTRPARVLVVDDEPSIATTVRRLLAGDDVTATTSPVEALELVTRGEDYDVVFCDLVMPELSGPMLYERVAALRPALASRFVFVTGAVTNVGAHDFLESVPNEHVDKPFQARTLRGIVRRMVAAPPTPGDERR